jgi:hypothetical protein
MASQGRGAASNAARRASQLNQLNTIGSNRSEFDTADMFNVVENDCADFISRVKTNIQGEPDFVNTGGIEDIKTEISATGIDIMIPNYLLFQDKGVNGSINKPYNTVFTYRSLRPPASVFVEMIKSRNIRLRDEAFYNRLGSGSRHEELDEDQKILNAAYAMATKVFKEGFRPRNVYSKEIPKLIQDVQQTVTNYLQSFIQQQIVNNDGSRTNIGL